MAAFFALVEVLVVVFSRVVFGFAVGVVGFDVGSVVDARLDLFFSWSVRPSSSSFGALSAASS